MFFENGNKSSFHSMQTRSQLLSVCLFETNEKEFLIDYDYL